MDFETNKFQMSNKCILSLKQMNLKIKTSLSLTAAEKVEASLISLISLISFETNIHQISNKCISDDKQMTNISRFRKQVGLFVAEGIESESLPNPSQWIWTTSDKRLENPKISRLLTIILPRIYLKPYTVYNVQYT